jgi:hypothetical protein
VKCQVPYCVLTPRGRDSLVRELVYKPIARSPFCNELGASPKPMDFFLLSQSGRTCTTKVSHLCLYTAPNPVG